MPSCGGFTPRETHRFTCSTGISEEDCTLARLGWIRGEITNSGTRLDSGKSARFCPKARKATSPLLHRRRRQGVCLTYEVVGSTGGLFLRATSGLDRPYHGLRTDAGYHQACFDVGDGPSLTELQFEWDRDEPDRWLNPLGLSGRDTVLLDRTGVKFHWFTWLTAN